ncbi:fungal-specific transcription factor domain-containing protein [Auriculariales sp. MPI-PUGE-AT-0066]|nr:fungal-specific transcription factor domain-containing protein [Auriculariales sp. MPI-PUGE-AT-0066]
MQLPSNEQLVMNPAPIAAADPMLDLASVRGPQLMLVQPQTQTGRGGCWTCRIRRKKCDEEDVDGKCSMCRRLKLDCLGWSTKRPDWMRDKQSVEEYKRKIKQQLMDQGMIRGQPKAGASAPWRSQPYAVPGRGMYIEFGQQQQQHFYRPNSQRPWTSSGSNSGTDDEFSSANSSGHQSEYFSPGHLATDGSPTDYNMFDSPVSAMTTNGDMSGLLFDPALLQDFTGQVTLPFDMSTMVNTTPDNGEMIIPTVPYSSPAVIEPVLHIAPTLSPNLQLGPARQRHVEYYFSRVRGFQYVFAPKDVTSTFCDLIAEQPHGAVTSALCSLAATHDSRMREAQGLPNPYATDAINHTRFYQDVLWQIYQSKQVTGKYATRDAAAAVHAVSFWLFQGGSGEWHIVLDIAREWLAQTSMIAHETPAVPLIEQDDKTQFATRATMWMDIFGSITQLRSPRFLDMYRRLFKGYDGYWSTSLGVEHSKLRMEGLMGCPDEVMLAIAETAELAAWAQHQRKTGKLSVRELVSRADAIERELRTQEAIREFATSSARTDYNEFDRLLNQPLTSEVVPSPQVAIHSSSSSSSHPSPAVPPIITLPSLPDFSSSPHPSSHHASPLIQDAAPMPPVDSETQMRLQVARVFRASAILYLYTVMSGPHPRVPEVIDAVATIVDALKHLPASLYDRSLVFPICLAGVMTNDPMHREFLRGRLSMHDTTVGNVGECRMLMEAVWERRDKYGEPAPDWIQVMQDLNMNLLLV